MASVPPVYYGVTASSTSKKKIPYPVGVTGPVTYTITLGTAVDTVTVPQGADLWVSPAAVVTLGGVPASPPPPAWVSILGQIPVASTVPADATVPAVFGPNVYRVPLPLLVEAVGGAQGHRGYQGDVGVQGHQGVIGAQGYQGYQGVTGAQGFQGFQGFQGHQGFQGTTGAGGTPGGSDTEVQFNDSGSFAGDNHLTWDKTNHVLTISSVTKSVSLAGAGNAIQAGDGTHNATLCDGVRAANFNSGSLTVSFAEGSHAAYFTDGTHTVTFCDGTNTITYTAGSSGNWAGGTPPTDVWVALDRIAAALSGLSAAP